MTDQELLKVKQVCCDRYLWRHAGSLLAWLRAQGKLSNAQIAPVNVHAVGIGFKRVGGRVTDTLCVQVTVLRKMTHGEVQRAGAPIIEGEIDGVPIDVVESGPLAIELQHDSPTHALAGQRLRPLRPGCAIRQGLVSGTLGAFCRSTRADERGQVFALTCRHVLGGFGNEITALPVFQPGGERGAEPVALKVARFVDSQQRPPRYRADASIVPLVESIQIDPDTLEIGAGQGVFPLLDMAITDTLKHEEKVYVKFGRTTGLTEGRIDVVRQDRFAVIANVERRFIDQFLVRRLDRTTPMSDPGDSGAMMFHKASRKAAGLVIGAPVGADNDEIAVVSPLQPILDELEIELI